MPRPPFPKPRARAPHRGAWNRGRRVVLALLLVGSLGVSGPGSAWNADRLGQAAARLGTPAVEGARDLRGLLVTVARLEEPARAGLVNEFFNRRIAFAEDLDAWGMPDYWASPLEVLVKGRGDCEDFAIAKYFVLRASGVPAQRLRLVYVRAQTAGRDGYPGLVIPHLVLAYYARPADDPLVLDNLVREVLPASRRSDLTPVFSFNSEGLWQGVSGGSAGDPLQRLSKWREVLARAIEEGFE